MEALDLTPTRSRSDRKTYRLLQFPATGFECLLVSSAYLLEDASTASATATATSTAECGNSLAAVEASGSGSSETRNSGVAELKGAAAMSVQVGSFADPAEFEGLAHFLEHMVFMGR
jgi:nardilysin